MPRTIVIGAGIYGLTAAFSLSLSGHEVLVIDNRKDYTRDQLILFPMDLVQDFYYLSDLPQLGVQLDETVADQQFKLQYLSHFKEPIANLDLNFFRMLEQKDCVIEIKDFQNYQLEKFKNLLKQRAFNYDVPQVPESESKHLSESEAQAFFNTIANAPAPVPLTFQREILKEQGVYQETRLPTPFALTGNVTFLMGPEYQVIDIDAERQILTLQENGKTRTIEFSNLVAADGAGHRMADLLISRNPKIKLSMMNLEAPRHNAYAQTRFSLNLDRKEIAEIYDQVKEARNLGLALPITEHSHARLGVHLCVEHHETLKQAGWSETYLPFIFLSIDKDTKECYVTGEIPKTLISTNAKMTTGAQQQALSEWFACIIHCLLDIAPSDVSWLRGSIFQVQPRCFEKNHVTLGKGGQFILGGDAFLPANFLYGHGVKAAIDDGNALHECFDDEGNDFDPYPLDQQAMLRHEEYNYYKHLIESSRIMLNSPLASNASANTFGDINILQRFNTNILSRSYFEGCNTYLMENSLSNSRRELSWLKKMKEDLEQQERDAELEKNPNAYALIISQKHKKN